MAKQLALSTPNTHQGGSRFINRASLATVYVTSHINKDSNHRFDSQVANKPKVPALGLHIRAVSPSSKMSAINCLTGNLLSPLAIHF